MSDIEFVAFGRYEVRRMLARRPHETLYDAWDAEHARTVTIKAVPRAAADADLRAGQLRHEAELGWLRHRNILTVDAYGETATDAYVVTESIAGSTVQALLDRGVELPVATIGQVMDGLLGALAHCHRCGVVHRAVAADNILVAADGRVMLCNMGNAWHPDCIVPDVIPGVRSPVLMAPEQVQGIRVGAATDIYAAGVVLYQMLTGRLPFAGSIGDVLDAVLGPTMPTPPSRIAAVPVAFDAIIARAMAKAPSARYPTAERFAEQLAPVIAASRLPSPARQPVPPAAPTLPARPRRGESYAWAPVAPPSATTGSYGRRWVLGAAALVGVALAVNTGLWFAKPAQHGPLPPASASTAALRPAIMSTAVRPVAEVLAPPPAPPPPLVLAPVPNPQTPAVTPAVPSAGTPPTRDQPTRDQPATQPPDKAPAVAASAPSAPPAAPTPVPPPPAPPVVAPPAELPSADMPPAAGPAAIDVDVGPVASPAAVLARLTQHCERPDFRHVGGQTLGEIHMVNDGGGCGTRLWASVREHVPVSQLSVAQPPQHGRVHISGNRFSYTPDPGYVGGDAFALAWQPDHGGVHYTVAVRAADAARLPARRSAAPSDDAYWVPAGAGFLASHATAHAPAAPGIEVAPVTPAIAQRSGMGGPAGVVVTRVASASAAVGQLRPGDVILAFGGTVVTTPVELYRAMDAAAVGQPVRVEVWRHRRLSIVQVTPVPAD